MRSRIAAFGVAALALASATVLIGWRFDAHLTAASSTSALNGSAR